MHKLFCIFILITLSCKKEVKISNYVSSSSSDLSQVACQEYTTISYYTQCWATGGPYNEEECTPIPIISNSVVCRNVAGDIVSNTYTYGGSQAGSPPPGTPAPAPSAQIVKAYLCGNYLWKKIGDAYYTGFTNLGFTLVHSDGVMQSIGIGTGCLEFPINQVSTTNNANKTWNEIWANSIEQVTIEVSRGSILPNDETVKARMIALLKTNTSRFTGSLFQSPDACSGVPKSKLTWCTERPLAY